MKTDSTNYASLLTHEQAAIALAISPRKLWNMVNLTKEIACVRMGRSVRFSRDEIDRFVSEHTSKS